MSELRDKTEVNENPDFMDKYFADAGIEDDTTSENGTDSQGGSTDAASTSGQDAGDKVEGASGADKLGGKSDSGKEQGNKEPKKADPNDAQLPAGSLKLRDGTIVSAGAERRWYEQMQLARGRETAVRNDLNKITQERDNIKTKYDALEAAVKQIGFDNPDAMHGAVSMYRDLARDPVGVVEKLLAELKTKGYDLSKLGAGVDTLAITNLLDRKLGPSEQRQNQEQDQQRIAQEAEQEVQDLLSSFPDAKLHEAYIAALVDDAAANRQYLPLREAYFQLRERAINAGFDWSQDLGPQIAAAKARQSDEQQQQQTQQQQQSKGPPRNVRGNGFVANQEEIDPNKSVAPANATSADIVRQAMRDHGMNV